MADKILFGLMVALIGMTITFIGLILLIVIVNVMGAIMKAVFRRGESSDGDGQPEPGRAAPVAQAPAAGPGALMAVIAAAVAAVWGSQAGFVVRRVRRVGVTAPSWAAAGRSDNQAR